MNATGCARAASDLTVLVHRLDRARRALVPGTVVEPAPGPAPKPAVSAPADPVPATAAAAAPSIAAGAGPGPVMESALVIPPPALESELAVPPTEPARCGTPEVLDELR